MENPNPIYYKDLITPDNSITQLISQLEGLIAEYDKAKSQIQGSAQQMAASIKDVSGATAEQRKQIELTTQQTDALLQDYQDTDKTLRALNEKYKDGNMALKEYSKIQKLVDTANREAEGSYNKLSAQYRLVKIRLNEMSAAERYTTETGRKLEAEAKALYERMNEMQKATGKAQLQVGQYERALGGLVGVNGRFLDILTDSTKRQETFNGIMAAVKTPIAGVIGAIGAASAAIKLYRESIQSTQATGDEFDNAMAGWTARWDLFKKAVATVDFSFFIQNAADAARAGRNLQAVLDEVFERTSSSNILRARKEKENEINLETLRDQTKSNAERIKAGETYLSSMKEIYDQETETARRVRDAQLNYLFSVTNTEKQLTEEEKQAGKERLANYIEQYNLNEATIKQAQRYLAAQKKVDDYTELLGKQETNQKLALAIISENEEIMRSMDDRVKQYVEIVKQYNLTNDAEVRAYVDAEVAYIRAGNAFDRENRRIKSQISALEKKQTDDVKTETKERAKAVKEEAKARKDAIAEGNAIRQAELTAIQLKVQNAKKGTDEELEYRLEAIEKQAEIEIELNRQKVEAEQQDEEAIIAKYDNLALKTASDFYNQRAMKEFDDYQKLQASEFSLLDRNERQKTIFRLQQEKARLEKVLELNKTAAVKLSETEIATIHNTIEGIQQEIDTAGFKNIYEVLGLNLSEKQQSAIDTALSSIKESIGGIIDAWKAAADASKESADKQVEAAQKVLDNELEAKRQGYAADVENAAAELQLAKETQAKAAAEQKKAAEAQQILDAVTQTSSLITASANLWASLSPIPVAGPILAATAIAGMFASFIASKVKAAQVTKYGEGTVELLEGGSHASGHDIDLGTTKDGRQRRAEGGEFFAIINKRNSRRYRDVIPDVIKSFNDGTFADKYQRANIQVQQNTINLSTLERDVAAIRKQGETQRMPGVIVHKNLTRRVVC